MRDPVYVSMVPSSKTLPPHAVADPGWSRPRSRALACLGAAGAAAFLYRLAFPPFDHAWVAWFTLVPLLLVVYRQPSAWAFVCGAAYGVASCYGTAATWAPQALARFFEVPFVVASLGLLVFAIDRKSVV